MLLVSFLKLAPDSSLQYLSIRSSSVDESGLVFEAGSELELAILFVQIEFRGCFLFRF